MRNLTTEELKYVSGGSGVVGNAAPTTPSGNGGATSPIVTSPDVTSPDVSSPNVSSPNVTLVNVASILSAAGAG